MASDFSLDIMKCFTEDLSMAILVLSQRIQFNESDLIELQIQNLINEILEQRDFFHNSNLFNLHIDLNLDEDVYSIEILLRKELDIEIRKKIYEDFESVNIAGNTKAIRNDNYSEIKIVYIE